MPRRSCAPAILALVWLALSLWLAGPVVSAQTEVREGSIAERDAPSSPDWAGLKRDTWYFVGYQVITVALLQTLPEEDTNFDRGSPDFSKWHDNVSNPAWDRDDLFVNYVLHPYWGAAYYIRGRERGLSRWQALGYSALLSTIYEFGAEAMFEPVSYQDLLITPLAGWLLGEYVFEPLRAPIKAKPEEARDALDDTLLVLTDPLGALNALTDRLFGVQTHVALGPIVRTVPSGPPASALALAQEPGAWAGPDWASARRVPWGLQMHLRW